jgi:Cu+-exporting ATPase
MEQVDVDYDPKRTDINTIQAKVRDAGFQATPITEINLESRQKKNFSPNYRSLLLLVLYFLSVLYR